MNNFSSAAASDALKYQTAPRCDIAISTATMVLELSRQGLWNTVFCVVGYTQDVRLNVDVIQSSSPSNM